MVRLIILLSLLGLTNAFTSPMGMARPQRTVVFRMNSEPEKPIGTAESTVETEEDDPMAEAELDAETRLQMEKARRADELRAQEVFMKKSTGIFKCSNCDWEYDETKGDKQMIGGMVAPGTKFEDLASNWRCPVCRASKDSFVEVVEEIPGFEVNQGYGFGKSFF